jgi:hypothetical protein
MAVNCISMRWGMGFKAVDSSRAVTERHGGSHATWQLFALLGRRDGHGYIFPFENSSTGTTSQIF